MNNNDFYFLGTNKEGKKVWLEKPRWDCGWYWGFGYLETMRGNREPSKAIDIDMHTHWDSCVRDSHRNAYDWFELEFGKTLTDSFNSKVKKEKGVKYCRFTNSQLWTLCELIETVYTLKETAEVLGRGGSHYTTNPCADIIQNKAERDRINSEVLPAIFAEIGKLFDEVDKAETPSKPIRGSGWQQPND